MALEKQRLIDYLMLLRQRQDKNDWTTKDIPSGVIEALEFLKLTNKSGIISYNGNMLTSKKLL